LTTITPPSLVCIGALSYGSLRATTLILAMLTSGVHPRTYGHLALSLLIAMAGVLGLSSPRARRVAVVAIALSLMYICAEPLGSVLLRREPSLLLTACAYLPAFLGATAVLLWACGLGSRLEDKWSPLGGAVVAYGALSAAAWLTGVLADRGFELSALLGDLQQFPVRAAAYFAPLALGLLCVIGGYWLMKGPAGHAFRFRAICICAFGASLIGGLPLLLIAYALPRRAIGFLAEIAPAIVTASLLAFSEYHRWRFGTKGLCSVCGYNMAGNVSGRCPECGTPLNTTAPAPVQR
jgi:hypothetical protein